MFTIIGDIIHYDGQPVAVFRRDVIPTVRDDVTRQLHDHDADCDHCEYQGEPDAETLAKLKAVTTERNAYAALLGVKPK